MSDKQFDRLLSDFFDASYLLGRLHTQFDFLSRFPLPDEVIDLYGRSHDAQRATVDALREKIEAEIRRLRERKNE